RARGGHRLGVAMRRRVKDLDSHVTPQALSGWLDERLGPVLVTSWPAFAQRGGDVGHAERRTRPGRAHDARIQVRRRMKNLDLHREMPPPLTWLAASTTTELGRNGITDPERPGEGA